MSENLPGVLQSGVSESLPSVLQSSMSEDQRPAKLHRQTDIENGTNSALAGQATASDALNGVSASASSTTQSRSNFSACFPDDAAKKTTPSSNNRKTPLSRGCALDGTSPPPPESVLNPTALSNGEAYNGQLAAGAARGSADRNEKLNGQSHEAKDLLLASHTVSSDSGVGTFDHTDESSDRSAPSRDSSEENTAIRYVYKDSTNTDIPHFFRETLHRSPKDKKTVLMLEDQLLGFIDCNSAQVHKTGELTSYDRMIVHRMAAFLGLEHNVDSTGRCVVLNKTENTRRVKLSEMIMYEDAGFEPKMRILTKKPASFDEKHGRGNSKAHFGSHRAKSLEERQQNYMVARERIFKNDETQPDEEPDYRNFVPYYSQDIKTNGHPPNKHSSTETSDYHKNGMHTPNSSSSIKPNYQSSPIMSMSLVTSPEYNLSACSSIVDVSPPPVTQLQPPVNLDGSLYQFDPTCPPPFMAQLPTRPPLPTPPPNQIMYQNDGVSEVTTRFSTASIGGLEQGGEPLTAIVPNQPVPFYIPQSVYTSMYPSQIMQVPYFVTSAAGQPLLHYVTLPQGQGQQLLQGAAVDTQGQVTVPMPPLGVPAVPNGGGYQMVGQPYQLTMALSQPSHSVDHNSVTYHYGPAPEAVMMAGAGGLNPSAPGRAAGAQQLYFAFPQPQPVSQQTQCAPPGTAPQGTYYSIPATTPTPPLSLTQPPPASHHHQQPPPTVFFTSGMGNQLTYPVSMPDPSSPSAASMKPVLTPFLQTQYISQLPKQQQHPHHPQPVLISPHNSHHPAPMTVNCNQPISYNPGQQLGQVATAQGPLLEAVQSPYQVRPLGTTLFHLAGNPVIQAPHLGANPHLQSYQFFRPAATDVRLVTPGSVRSRLSPLQITNTSNPRPRYNSQYRHPKKSGRKPASNVEGYHVGQGPSTGHQTAHVNIIAPLGMSASVPLPHPHIQSSVPLPHPHIQSSAHRQ